MYFSCFRNILKALPEFQELIGMKEGLQAPI